MTNISKQSAASATSSKPSKFKSAVWRLTAYYTLAVIGILIAFNALVYGLLPGRFDIDDGGDDLRLIANGEIQNMPPRHITPEEVRSNLIAVLFYSDILVLVFAIGASYFTAKKTLKPLEESYIKQERFVADVAHELRTPLTVMKAGSELMLKSPHSQKDYEDFIRESLEEVDRLTMLSNDLLFILKNDSKLREEKDSVDLSEITKKQIENMRAYAESKDVKIIGQIENIVNISGNKNDLTRLVINLLKNAIDYNKPNGEVIIKLSKKSSNAILEISDTGIGMKNEDIGHIFERFYKADNSRTNKTNHGVGLGLAIVEDIVNKHKGSIEAKSEIGVGTTFKITLPLA